MLSNAIGIPEVELKAKLCRKVVEIPDLATGCENPFLTEDEILEMRTRITVRVTFSDALSGKLSSPDLKALENVLFDLVYPCLRDVGDE
jgi:hypothetical protein